MIFSFYYLFLKFALFWENGEHIIHRKRLNDVIILMYFSSVFRRGKTVGNPSSPEVSIL
jgi:hypothetical protein